jgi:hypothetical protein
MSAVSHSVLTSDGLDALLDVLRRRGFRVLGPTVRDRSRGGHRPFVCRGYRSEDAAQAARTALIQPELIAIHLRAGVLAILLPRSESPPIVDPVLVG